MTVALLDVAAETTPADVAALLLKWLSDTGLPATSWAEESVPRRLIAGESVALADAMNLAAAIANGNILDYSAGDWLTLLASNVYQLDRKLAIAARGPVLVTNNSGSTQTITAGQLLVRSTQTGAVFRNLAGFSVLNGATVSADFQAELAGLVGNAAVNTVTDPLTPIPGVTFNNPGASNVWLTQIGTREESDESLRTRCKARWPQFGGGPTLLAYEGWALSIAQVTQARVFPNTDGGGFVKDGKVLVVVAGDSNPLAGAVTIAVDAYIQPRAGLCVRVETQAAAAYDVPIVATLYVEPAYLATSASAADSALRTLVASRRIGQRLYRAEIVEALMSVPGAGNAVVTSPVTDAVVPQTSILSLLTAPVITIAPLP